MTRRGARAAEDDHDAVEILSSRVLVHAVDLTASRAFYEGTLGLRVYREYGAGGEVGGVVYFLGGGFLELSSGVDTPGARGTCLWLQVPDVAAEERRLSEAAVPVRKPAARMPWGLIECWVEAPDGVELRLVEVPDDHPLRRRVR